MKKKFLAFLLSALMLVSLLPMAAFAACDHKFIDGKCTLCGEDDHDHNHAGWTAWGGNVSEQTSFPTEAGNYYLTHDIEVTKGTNWVVPQGTEGAVKVTNLCLNGYIIQGNDYDTGSYIAVNAYTTLNIYDCDPLREHEGYIDAKNLWHPGTGGEGTTPQTVCGGVITGFTTGVQCDANSVINLYGGNICGTMGCGTLGEFNINGGSISYNYFTGVSVGGNGKITMNSGTVSHIYVGAANSNYGAVSIGRSQTNSDDNPQFIMNGGTISYSSGGSARGAGVNVKQGTFTMNGGTIEHNKATLCGAGVFVNVDGTFNMNGGSITDNACVENPTQNSGAVFNKGNMSLSGKCIIKGNTAGAGQPQNLVTMNPITISGALTGSEIYIGHSDYDELRTWDATPDTGVLTSGYKTNNPDAGLYTFFRYDGPDTVKITEPEERDAAVCMVLNTDGELEVKEIPDGSYKINVESSPNGTVSAPAYAASGAEVTLTVTPDAGYQLKSLKWYTTDPADATDITSAKSFTMPAANVTVTAEFEEESTISSISAISAISAIDDDKPAARMSFRDVQRGAYYYDAVQWAVENGITTGKTSTEFDPTGAVTRAQAVTFLWRAAGCPKVNYFMKFTDLKPGAYYTEAVRWAVASGITKGVDAKHFDPDATCTRAQIVSFLYRYSKANVHPGSNPFTDVAADAYYCDAVLWAVANGITAGKTANTFAPAETCNRAQVVSFLYRYMGK